MKILKRAYDYTSISLFPFCPHSLHEPSYTFQDFFPINSKANANTHAVTPEPHDEIIMKQIPGEDATAAETARAEIRTRYATIQTDIDNATTVDELKTVHDNANLGT